MSETATRTASRGRGRGRGRGGSLVAANSRQSANTNSRVQPTSDAAALDDDPEMQSLREKYGGEQQLGLIQAIFPDWTQQDILSTLKDANGDTELAINRISEGQAEQWGAVKTKKAKQAQRAEAAAAAPTYSHTSSTRGRGAGRGRGGGDAGSHEVFSHSQQRVESAPVKKVTPVPTPATNGNTPAIEESPAAAAMPEPVKQVPVQTQPQNPTKAAPKRPTAGSAISWAQIAKPQEVAKPAPEPRPAEEPETHTETQPLETEEQAEYTQTFDTTKNDPWASTPAAATSTTQNYPSAPLGVGEGWAETVLSNNGDEVATNQQAYHHAAGSPDVSSAMPTQGSDPAGPIEVAEQGAPEMPEPVEQAPASLEAPLQAYSGPVAAHLEAQAEQQDQQQLYSSVGNLPPGFGKAQSNTSTNASAQRPTASQSPADRIGVQFGSLGLFDPATQQPSAQSQNYGQAHTQPGQSMPHDSQDRFTYPTQSQNNDRFAQGQAQTQPQAQNQGTAYAQQSAQQYAGYGQAPPATQQQQQDFSHAYLQHYQQQQQQNNRQQNESPAQSYQSNGTANAIAPTSAPAPSASPYAALSDQHAAYYGQHAQAQANAYGYGAISQQQQAQPDYSSLYNMQQPQAQNDALRSLYGGYGYDQSQQGAYTQRTTSGQADDSTKAASHTPQPSQQQQQTQQVQQSYGYPAGYSQYPYYGYPSGYPTANSPYQQAASPYAQYQQYGAGRPPYQQTQSGHMQPQQMGGYRGQMPAPAAYAQPQQQGYYQQRSYNQGAATQQTNERDNSSYKNFGGDF